MSRKNLWLSCIVVILFLMIIPPTWAQFNLQLVGRDPFGKANAVFVSSNYAYVCVESTLLILNVGNPANIIKVGAFEIPDTANDVYVIGNYAYVAYGDDNTATNENGLYIVNISSPSAPWKVGSYSTPAPAKGVYFTSGHVYLTAGNTLYAISTANPANPAVADSENLGSPGNGIYVTERFTSTGIKRYAFVATDNGLRVFDALTPASLLPKGSYNIDDATDVFVTEKLVGVSIERNAFLTAGNRLYSIDASDPDTLVERDSVAVGGNIATSVYVTEKVVGSTIERYAYVSSGTGLYSVNASDPDDLTLSGSVNIASNSNGVFAVIPRAFVSANNGLHVININNPADLIPLGNYNTAITARGVYAISNFAYVTAPDSSLRVVNASTITNPQLMGSCPTPGDAIDVFVFENIAYVADGNGGLRVINVPTNPTQLTFYNNFGGGEAKGVYVIRKVVSGIPRKYAFVAAGNTGLYILSLNVTNPSEAPQFVSSINTGNANNANDVFVLGNYAYVADKVNGLQIVNISNPEAPTLEGGIRTTLGDANKVYVVGDHAFVTNGNGVNSIDVIDPKNPTIRGTYQTTGDVYGIHVTGNYAYLAVADNTGFGGLHVLDVSNPASPFRVALYKTPINAHDVYVSGNYAYLTDSVKGLYVFAANTHTITATADEGGRITPSGAVQVGNGESIRFTIRADRGQSIRDVRVDGRSVGAVTEYTFTNVRADHTIYASFEETRYSITSTAGANGTISPYGTVSRIREGESVTFKMIPNTGYKVATVKVDGVVTSMTGVNEYTFQNIRDNHTIEVTFEPTKYNITASADANGVIFPSGQIQVSYGASQTFSMTPNAGYAIKDVLVDGVSAGAVNTYTFSNISADHTISVTFAPVFTITATAGNFGTIDPSGEVKVASGGSQKFTMTPFTGYSVADVKVDNVSIGAVNEYTFTNVTANHSINVTFALKTYTITATAGVGGSISPSGTVAVSHGGNQKFDFIPDTGYNIADVKVDGVSVGAVQTYTIANVTGNRTIDVSFSLKEYNIVVAQTVNGSISPSGVVKVKHGANQTFAITPATGYSIADVKADGSSVGAVNSYTFTNVTADHTISASFEINKYKVISKAGDGGTISPLGETIVEHGGSQTFTITPNDGFRIVDVKVNERSVGQVTSYTISNITSDQTIEVTFSAKTYILRASAGFFGSISPSGEIPVAHGAEQTFIITPITGYRVDNVIINGVPVSGVTGSYTFKNITSNNAIYVTFTRSIYEITATAGDNGSISPAGVTKVGHGGKQKYEITPNANYRVADVIVDGQSVGAVSSYEFVDVTSNHTISATFAIKTYTIKATAGANGTISPSGDIVVDHGATQAFSFKADENYHIADVVVNGRSMGPINTYTFANITSNHTINVIFAINTFTITASAGSNGSITPSGAVKVNYGADQTFAITPAEGYAIKDVVVDGESVGAVSTYTFTKVDTNHTISASFEIKVFTITAKATENGTISPSGEVKVNYGATVVFTITPSAGARLVDVKIDGKSYGPLISYMFTLVKSDHTITATFEKRESALLQNFPNPFNPETWIPYQLKDDSPVMIRIYNSAGILVRELDLGYKTAGLYDGKDKSAYWDGKDKFGLPVASGVYFYEISAGKFSAVKKMIVLK